VVRQVLGGVMAQLGPGEIAAETRATLELVLAEVLNNVVEHAYRGRPDGEVELSICLGAEAVTCEVLDRGEAMPDVALPPGHPPDLPEAGGQLPEGGFGWFLIRSLTRGLDYSRSGGRNRLVFALPVETRAAHEPEARRESG
jgi:serine/threonine-protein kinase RsbW